MTASAGLRSAIRADLVPHEACGGSAEAGKSASRLLALVNS